MGEEDHPSQLLSHLCLIFLFPWQEKDAGGGSSYDTLVCLLLIEGLAGNFNRTLATEGSSRAWGRQPKFTAEILHV